MARLDTMVTVVDAYNFARDYGSHDRLHDRGETMGDEDERRQADYMIISALTMDQAKKKNP